MNTDLVTPSTQKTSGQPVGLPSDVPQSKIKVAGPAWSQNSKIPTPVHRKIAKLPKPLRDLINSSLDDGLSARQIIEKLQASTNPPLPYPISAMNISDWRKTGHQRYLRQEEWRDQLRILRENGSDMSELADGPKFQETLIQIALTEIFRVLQEGELKPDSLNYIRLFNALARLNREALSLRKYNDQLAKEEVALKQLDPNRKLTDNEHRAIADIIDQVMEMPRPRPLWSAPAERSGDGALGDSARTAPSADPVPAASFAEVGRGVLTAPPAFPNEPAASNCPPSPSNPSSPLPSRPCRAEPPDPCSRREEAEAQTCDQQSAHDPPATESHATDCSLLTFPQSKIHNPKFKTSLVPPNTASTAVLLSHPSLRVRSAVPKTTAHLAECVFPTSASATSPGSITASTATLPNPPFYPAANALVPTATNAANASTTPKTYSRFLLPIPNHKPRTNHEPPSPLINTLLQQGAAATQPNLNSFNCFLFFAFFCG